MMPGWHMTIESRNQAHAVFREIIDLPSVDRSKALFAGCNGDEAMIAYLNLLVSAADRAVEIVAPAETCRTTVDSPASNTLPATVEGQGLMIGSYKLLQAIGEGGFGVVYVAEQVTPVRRRVALKLIKRGMDTKEVLARFDAERQALAMMDHPNIARVFDAGMSNAGNPFFVMELVNGIPITAYCDDNHRTPRERLELMVVVCRAVQSAHSKGVIHRDLKPSNVLVALHDGKPMPKVIDFGIAKATGASLTDKTLFTVYHQFVGTPEYMSPEQAEMSGLDIDTRADVYSLGVLLYELLTGRTPIEVDRAKTGYGEMARLIKETEPTKPSTRISALGDKLAVVASCRGTDAKKLRQLVKGEVDWIVMKALEKDRARRYDTAAALADDIERHLHCEVVAAGPPNGFYRLRKITRRYRTAIAILFIVAAALIVAVTGIGIGLVRESNQRHLAETQRFLADKERAVAMNERAEAQRQRADAETQRQSAEAVVDFLKEDVLERATPDRIPDKAMRETVLKALIEPAMADIGDRFKSQPLIEAAVRYTLADALLRSGNLEPALTQVRQSWRIRHDLLGDEKQLTIQSLSLYSSVLNALGRDAEAEPMGHHAWQSARLTLGEDHVDTIAALNNYTLVLQSLGRFREAEPLILQVLDHNQRTLGEMNPDTIAALANYVVVLRNLNRRSEALPLAGKAWDQSRQLRGDNNTATINLMNNYAVLLQETKHYAEATTLAKEVWERRGAMFGPDHPATISSLSNYAAALCCSGKSSQALEFAREALEQSRRIKGVNHPETLLAAQNYAAVLRVLGNFAEAERVLNSATSLPTTKP